MQEALQKSRLRKRAWIAVPVLFLGYYGATSGKLPLAWIWMILCGAAAIWLEFDGALLRGALGKMKKGSAKYIAAGIVITLAVSFLALRIGVLLGAGAAGNPNVGAGGTPAGQVLHVIVVSISLIGEELMTAAFAFPAFALLKKRVRSQSAWIAASVISALLFGMMHVGVYQWNLYQCLVATGLTRLPFNWVWRKTDSLWGGVIAHVIYDLCLLVPALFV